MYSLPAASQIRELLPRTIYGGSQLTDLKARTGEFTPPGITWEARAWSLRDLSWPDIADQYSSKSGLRFQCGPSVYTSENAGLVPSGVFSWTNFLFLKPHVHRQLQNAWIVGGNRLAEQVRIAG